MYTHNTRTHIYTDIYTHISNNDNNGANNYSNSSTHYTRVNMNMYFLMCVWACMFSFLHRGFS